MKKIAIVSFLFIISISLFAQNSETIKSNKSFLPDSLPKLSKPDSLANKTELPKPTNWVSDFEKIFTQQQRDSLNNFLNNYELKTTNEIAVVTLDSTLLKGKDFDKFIIGLHNKWGVGKKEKNNGILIAISVVQRKVRINNGYGIEKIISNEETKEIIENNFKYCFKEGKYFEGLMEGLQVLISKL